MRGVSSDMSLMKIDEMWSQARGAQVSCAFCTASSTAERGPQIAIFNKLGYFNLIPMVPKSRLNRASRRKRASHFALKKVKLTACPKCTKPIMSHHACAACGYYNGRDVLKLESKRSSK